MNCFSWVRIHCLLFIKLLKFLEEFGNEKIQFRYVFVVFVFKYL